MVPDTKLAWLAGLIDGEGSVGAHCVNRKSGGVSIVGCIQMSMTCEATMLVARNLLLEIGITAVAHHHQERDPEKHRDAHYWRVSRVADVVKLTKAILPYSVTKRHHLELLQAFAQSRLDGQPLDAGGRIASRSRKRYTEQEKSLQQQLSTLNLRGAESMARGHA